VPQAGEKELKSFDLFHDGMQAKPPVRRGEKGVGRRAMDCRYEERAPIRKQDIHRKERA